MIRAIELESIDIYGGTQTRAATNDEAVAGYAEAMEAGSEFPAIIVYFDGAKYWLADGFHRFLASKRLERKEIAAEVREGSRSDALIFALGANAENGLYRTNADKRSAVEIALEEWPDKSNAYLADICKVSVELVRKCRKSMNIQSPDKVTGKDGKQYPSQIERLPRGESEKAERDELAGSDSALNGGGAGSAAGGTGKPASGGDFGAIGGSSAELEAEARKMVRDGELHVAELDKMTTATATDYAYAAISAMKRIRTDDPNRVAAIELIERWAQSEKEALLPVSA